MQKTAHKAQIQDVEQDPIELGRQNGMTVIDRRSKQDPAPERTPADPIAEKAREIEGAAYNGSTYPLQNLAIWAMKRGLKTTDIVSDERVEELEAIAIRMAKRIKELETTMPLALEKAIIVSKGLGKPDPLNELFAKITAEDRKSKKIRKLIFPADEAMRLFEPNWQKH